MPLTARQCAALPSGRHADGNGLYLNVTPAGGRSWVYRFTMGTKRREMGLGSFPELGLSDARKARDEWAAVLRAGRDPLAVREERRNRAAAPGKTLADMTQAAFEARRPSLRDEGGAGRWLSPLRVHVLPRLGKRDVESLTQGDIADTLRPIWREKPDAAKKALLRLGLVMQHAAARGFAVDLNAPALAREILGDQGHAPQHIASVAYSDLPRFYGELNVHTPVMLALRLLILTASRSRPIRFAHVSQFDLDAAIWTIPAEGKGARMKGRKGKAQSFRIPLSAEALAVVREAIGQARGGYLFPGPRADVLSDMALSAFMRRAGLDARPHGFRSSFRDWAAETGVPEHLAEMCLAHSIGNAASRAYRRTDEIEARARIMEAWAGVVTGIESEQERGGNVAYLPIVRENGGKA
ncbi:MAG: integrase arm-type DNA-binding domain-containing protein [Paracoccaceae bacterium]